MLPDSLYSEFRDYTQGVRPTFLSASNYEQSTAQEHVVDVYTVPDEYYLELNTVALDFSADGGETCDEASIRVTPPTGASFKLKNFRDTTTTQTFYQMDWSGSLLLPTGTIIRVQGKADAGVQNKFVQGWVVGWLIPEIR